MRFQYRCLPSLIQSTDKQTNKHKDRALPSSGFPCLTFVVILIPRFHSYPSDKSFLIVAARSTRAFVGDEKERPTSGLEWLPWAIRSALIRHLCGTANISSHKPRLPNMGRDLPKMLVQRCSSVLRGVGCSFVPLCIVCTCMLL